MVFFVVVYLFAWLGVFLDGFLIYFFFNFPLGETRTLEEKNLPLIRGVVNAGKLLISDYFVGNCLRQWWYST